MNVFEKEPHKRISTKDLVYKEIKQQIVKGILKPGQALVEKELSLKFKVSRTPLRSALQELEFDNLVERKNNGRIRVASISVKQAKEIFEVRGKLEEIATEKAAEKRTEKDIEKMKDIILMIKQSNENNNIDNILYYGDLFHSYIYKISENETVEHIISLLNVHIHRYLRLFSNHNSLFFKGDFEEHELILKHIIERNKSKAKSAMRMHIVKSLSEAVRKIELENTKGDY